MSAQNELRTADKRWNAIKRTQRSMTTPDGEDIGALLSRSVDAYWAQAEAEATVELNRQNPRVFRRAAHVLGAAGGVLGGFFTFRWVHNLIRRKKDEPSAVRPI